MFLKRIIRQYLNQHLPENIKPGQRLDRKAKKIIHGTTLRQELEKQGIIVRCDSNVGLAEEAARARDDWH